MQLLEQAYVEGWSMRGRKDLKPAIQTSGVAEWVTATWWSSLISTFGESRFNVHAHRLEAPEVTRSTSTFNLTHVRSRPPVSASLRIPITCKAAPHTVIYLDFWSGNFILELPLQCTPLPLKLR